RLLDETTRLVKGFYRERLIERVKGINSSQVVVISLPAAGWLRARALGLSHSHMRSKDRDDRAHHVVLDRKDIFERAVVALGPTMRSCRRIDQLRGDTNAVAPTP